MRRRNAGRGFTLVEILVVIAIIIILVGTVVAIGTAVRTSAHRKQTVMTLKNLDGMLKVYVEEVGSEPAAGTADFVAKFQAYPATKRGLMALPNGVLVWNGTTGTVNDGFGNAITFEPTAGTTPARFRSYGPDGVSSSGTASTMADDILSTEVQ